LEVTITFGLGGLLNCVFMFMFVYGEMTLHASLFCPHKMGKNIFYKVFRVYNGSFRGYRLYEVLSNVDRIIVYYSFDGYVYVYLVARASDPYRFRRAVFTLCEEVEVEEAIPNDVMGTFEALNIPYEFLNKETILGEGDLGYALVLGYGTNSSVSERGLVKYGVYRYIPSSESRNDIIWLNPVSTMLLEDAPNLVNNFLRFTTHVKMSKYNSPLKLRKGSIHIDGSTQYVRGFYIQVPDVSLNIPLDHHIFLIGESGSGKSVGIANIIRYILHYTKYRVIVFDWIGNFLSLANTINDTVIIRPGEDIHIDLHKVFDKNILPEIYEEASLLYFKGSKTALFTPAVYEKLTEVIKNVDSHYKMIRVLEDMKVKCRREDDRSAIMALLRRIRSLDPTLYIPMDEEDDLLTLLDKHRLVIVDLSAIPSEMDKILFTLVCLKILYLNWDSSKPKLYIVIDEVHRLAPRSSDREWLLSRVAREGLKYNIHLILADQTLTNISEDIWGNMGHKFIFNVSNPRDIDRVSGYLLPLVHKLKQQDNVDIKAFIIKLLKLKPGECILLKRDEEEPIQCYFKYLELMSMNQINRIDEGRFRKVLKEIKINENHEEDLRTIAKAKKLIRKYYPEELVETVKKWINNPNTETLELDRIILAVKENGRIRIRKALKIYLKYYGLNPKWYCKIDT